MSSHIAIVESLRHAAAAGESVVLATVVRVVGSSYGGVGTRMVIRVDGSTVGLVSGGCLESDLCAHAVEVHSTGRARLVTYDTRADDDAVWGLGLGCNGLIDVLLMPLSPERAIASADLLAVALSADEPSVIATVIQSEPVRGSPAVGAQALFGATEMSSGDWGDGTALVSARSQVAEALAAGRTGVAHQSDSAQTTLEVVTPAIRLVVCGSGPDAVPVCRLARALGWDVSLLEHRAITEAHARRFPDVTIMECPDAGALPDVVPLRARTAAVVMSHHFSRDTDYVRALLAANIAYVGVLGPRARTERMLAELATRGHSLPDTSDALFGPVGLDLGGDGPEAIALAIIAEVSAVMHARDAVHL
ncbi:MAG: XdhC family protein, partial [Gemmatimonadaceae bacterium]